MKRLKAEVKIILYAEIDILDDGETCELDQLSTAADDLVPMSQFDNWEIEISPDPKTLEEMDE